MVKYRRVFYQYDFDPDRPGLKEFIDVFCGTVREIHSQDKYQVQMKFVDEFKLRAEENEQNHY